MKYFIGHLTEPFINFQILVFNIFPYFGKLHVQVFINQTLLEANEQTRFFKEFYNIAIVSELLSNR